MQNITLGGLQVIDCLGHYLGGLLEHCLERTVIVRTSPWKDCIADDEQNWDNNPKKTDAAVGHRKINASF